jgi:rhodanese-related sulfurtransferase
VTRLCLVNLKPVSRLTRRFHLPSALRPTPFRIDPPTAESLVDGGALLIDVRRQDDLAATLEGAERIMPDEIPGRLSSLPRDTPIVLACT